MSNKKTAGRVHRVSLQTACGRSGRDSLQCPCKATSGSISSGEQDVQALIPQNLPVPSLGGESFDEHVTPLAGVPVGIVFLQLEGLIYGLVYEAMHRVAGVAKGFVVQKPVEVS